ncbi:MAG TPA: GAF domain-containing protein [Pirellulales bacterium]|jgi:PAS domain S-box-containing protein|nr:GAF domain-containing protein [Pirellulales bacterium]
MLSSQSTPLATPLPTEVLGIANGAAADDGWHSLLVTMGRWAVARADVALVVQDAATLLAETLDVEFGMVARLTDDQRTFQVSLTPRGGNSPPITYQTPADDPQSLVGRVLTTGHPLAITDLAADGQAKDPRLLAAAARGLILCPLRFFNQPFGALGVLTTKPREFRQRQTLLVEVAAHFITTTIAHHQAEQALAVEREGSEILLATLEALAIVVTPAGRLVRLNATAERITGFSSGEVRDRSIFSALLVAEEVALFEAALATLTKGGATQKLDGWVLTKTGDRRRIAWTCAPHAMGGAKPTILCTGIDVTPLRLANEELAVARAAAATFQQQAEQHAQQLERIRREVVWMESTPWSDGGPPAFMQIGDSGRNERRKSERRPYPYVQLLAPVIGNQSPAQEAFEKILCHDISSGGFSFFAQKPPKSKQIVAAFGVPGSLTYLAAEIVHCQHVPDKQMYLVGCRYVGRAGCS